MANGVRIPVSAPGAKQASSEIDQLRDRFTKLQQTSAKGLAIGAGAAITTKALNVLGGAVGDVTGFLEDSVTAYRDQQVASARLDQSLKQNATSWDGNTSAIQAQIDARTKFGFTDTDLTNSLGQLVGATHDVTKALDAQSVAMDLARYKQISLADASQLVVNVMAGNYRGLKQLGIATTGIHDATSALAAIEAVAGGQAQQYAQTDLGKMDVAYAQVDEAQEKFGKGLSKIEAVLLPAAAEGVGLLGDSLDSLQTSFDGTASAQDKLQAGTTFIDDLAQMFPILQGTADKLDGINAALQSTGQAASGLDAHAGKLADDNASLTQSFLDAAGGAGRTADTIEYLRTQEILASGSTAELATELETELFGKAITAGQKADIKNQIHSLQVELEKTKNKGDATVIKGQIASLKEQLFQLDLQEAESQGPAALKKFLDDSAAKFKHTDQKAYELTQQLIALYTAAGKLGNTSISVHVAGAGKTGVYQAALGGIFKARPGGTLVNLAEAGQDEAVVPLGPQGNGPPPTPLTALGSGGSVTINLNITTPVMTPGVVDQIGRVLEPVISRALQRKGLATARAF